MNIKKHVSRIVNYLINMRMSVLLKLVEDLENRIKNILSKDGENINPYKLANITIEVMDRVNDDVKYQ